MGLQQKFEEPQLFLPDRFDMLQRRAGGKLDGIVIPVDTALDRIKGMYRELQAAGRGSFLIFRGSSGSGKSTFLNTVNLFVEDVEVRSVLRETSIEDALRALGPTDHRLRVFIIEGRDALRLISEKELEASIHEINSFLRSERGERTLIVWPANADDLEQMLISICRRVGGDALLGIGEPAYKFTGPPKEQFIQIAARTVAALGITEERAQSLVSQAETPGQYLGLLRADLLKNQAEVDELLSRERCRLWVLVAASNDPEGDVAGVTRGSLSIGDIDRLMNATGANIVSELKKFPEKLGILAALLDFKIIHLPLTTASAIARDYADFRLVDRMKAKALSIIKSNDAKERLLQGDLARAFNSAQMTPRAVGRKPGQNTVERFKKLAEIASTNDGLLNGAVGRALVAAELITEFDLEKDLAGRLTRYTDIYCRTNTIGTVRLEVMWRATTSRAEIANYALTKLYNYGKAIGLFD